MYSLSHERLNLLTSSNNLTNKYTIKGIFNNWGGVAKNEIDVDEMLPTIAFHGEQDPTVRIDLDTSFANYSLRGSRSLHTELTGKNICSELTVDKTGGHGIYRNASSKFRAQRASCFFKRVFCKTCASFYTTDSVASNCSASPNLNVNNFDSKIKVFPNPFDKSFRIISVEGLLDLTICNSVGQIVYQKEAVDGEIELDLNPGIYFLQARHLESNTSYSTKLIKN
ncbi:MAG: T9SS type A sorting domain-containing protein [Bacteroidetes bacterium]|nr:T9SS type A sorting domain-containing protein [Bacteroidota bacterium]